MKCSQGISVGNMSEWLKKFVIELGKDFTSLRATWNWIYLGLYVFLAIYGALKVRESFSTIIVTTGSVVSVLFTNYVIGKKKGSNDTEN